MIFSVHRERAIQHKKQGIRGRTLLDQQPPAQKILAGHCIKKIVSRCSALNVLKSANSSWRSARKPERSHAWTLSGGCCR
jgi:hypothetical protein